MIYKTKQNNKFFTIKRQYFPELILINNKLKFTCNKSKKCLVHFQMNLSGGTADRRAFTSAVVAVFEEQCDFAGVPRLHSEIKKTL